MKKITALLLAIFFAISAFAGCTNAPVEEIPVDEGGPDTPTPLESFDGTAILLSDSGITVNGEAASTDETQAVYIANDIVFYESGHDFTYGEGTESDVHSKEAADAHTVVHITQPGQYVLSGTLSKGQIAMDLGDDAKEDPDAVVTLVLDNVDITCEVAPAVIFYNVYECGAKGVETAVKDIDTSSAGANVIIADGSINNITGAYVARIYDPDTVVLNESGTEVKDAEKLHKYDAAFYSKRSMNVSGGELGNGVLNINAVNEGLDSELHLTINSGNINIVSGNDGINTNEDNVSVTTINGGSVNILVNGATGEGDGIDSNGWLVINGGTVKTQACAFSGDAGIDSDMGIHINGGTVLASGNMLDRISESTQNYAVFTFNSAQKGGVYTLKNVAGQEVIECDLENDFTYLILSAETLAKGEYTLWCGDIQLKGVSSENGSAMAPAGEMQRPEDTEMPAGMTPPESHKEIGQPMMPESTERPEDMEMPVPAQKPDDILEMPVGKPTPPDGMTPPEGGMPGDMRPNSGMFGGDINAKVSEIFVIKNGGNYFRVIG